MSNQLQNHVGVMGGAYSKPVRNLYLKEIFDKADKAEDPVEFLKSELKREIRLTHILGYCINPNFKLADGIGEGEPPYKPSNDPEGFGSIDILGLWNQLYILLRQDIKRFKKEEFLIRWLEEMWEPEAKLLIAVKDQKVTDLYPKLTEAVFVDALGWDKVKFEELKKAKEQK